MQRKRGRGRRSGGNNNNNPNRHYESTGPDVKIRGSAQQILDKYQQYARDALTAGDRVKAEAHFQHAEHYARIVALTECVAVCLHTPSHAHAPQAQLAKRSQHFFCFPLFVQLLATSQYGRKKISVRTISQYGI